MSVLLRKCLPQLAPDATTVTQHGVICRFLLILKLKMKSLTSYTYTIRLKLNTMTGYGSCIFKAIPHRVTKRLNRHTAFTPECVLFLSQFKKFNCSKQHVCKITKFDKNFVSKICSLFICVV